MTIIPLTQNYSLSTEHYQKLRVRLIVFKNDEVYVCRKESIYKLKQFLTLDEGRAFRGRLQLVKHGDIVALEVKGEIVGRVTNTKLKGLLKALV